MLAGAAIRLKALQGLRMHSEFCAESSAASGSIPLTLRVLCILGTGSAACFTVPASSRPVRSRGVAHDSREGMGKAAWMPLGRVVLRSHYHHHDDQRQA